MEKQVNSYMQSGPVKQRAAYTLTKYLESFGKGYIHIYYMAGNNL